MSERQCARGFRRTQYVNHAMKKLLSAAESPYTHAFTQRNRRAGEMIFLDIVWRNETKQGLKKSCANLFITFNNQSLLMKDDERLTVDFLSTCGKQAGNHTTQIQRKPACRNAMQAGISVEASYFYYSFVVNKYSAAGFGYWLIVISYLSVESNSKIKGKEIALVPHIQS